MNILFLTQVLPYPLDAGPKVRAYHVLRYLAQQHSVTLVSFTRTSDTPAAISHLREICHAVHCVPMPRSLLLDAMHFAKSLLRGKPFIIERDWVPEMAQLLETLAQGSRRFDAIHADQLWMAPYALWTGQIAGARRSQGRERPLLVLDQHNAVYLIPQRLAEHEGNWLKRRILALESHKLARFEVDTCLQFDRVTWVTREDYEAVQQQAQRQAQQQGIQIGNAGVIPICADAESVTVAARAPTARRVTFLGGLHYPPNAEGVLWFAREVFPQVLRAMPEAVLTVIGKQPPASLKSFGIPAKNLDVTGYVDDLDPYLDETAVSIVPLHSGGGMRVKILDAWSKAIPIVSTTIGAEGIETCPGKNILIADSPADFADATLRVLQNAPLAEQLAQGGRRHVLDAYHWRTRYQAWDSVYA
ncbi:MAG: glycosyltransferase [Caldilineaceae bacterium]|nr:glycosyltransferase [Caldilineaceae bacterium]